MQIGGRRISPSMRQSAIGLMLLVSLGFLGWLVLWLTHFSWEGSSYRATIVFPNAGGMTPGTRVSYRGVKIGRVVSVKPETEGVAIEVEISPPDRLISSNVLIEAVQSGLVGETTVDITPLVPLPPGGVKAKPLDPECDPDLIICNGSRLQGEGKLDVNALIRSLLKISDLISDPEVTTTLRAIAQKTSRALDSVNQFSGKASGLIEEARQSNTLSNLNSTLRSTGKTAEEFRGFGNNASALIQDLRSNKSLNNLNSTLASVGGAAEQIRVFMTINQGQVADTVASVGQTSDQLRATVKSLDPLIQQANQGELLRNLEVMSANAVELSGNLRDFSTNLNDPTTILMLQQILDSARSSFDNIQKITSDLDELTGNPKFRNDLLRLIQGLSSLVSSMQELQQQVQYAQVLERVGSEISKSQSQNQQAPTSGNQPIPPTSLTAPKPKTSNNDASRSLPD